MNSDSFKKLIRETVNSELKKVLPEILKDYFDSSSKDKVSESKSPTIHIKPVTVIIDNDVKKEIKQYAKNPILNGILNETAVKIQRDGFVGDKQGSQSVQHTNSVMDSTELPGTLSNVFNRNYSTLLKAVDSAAKKQR